MIIFLVCSKNPMVQTHQNQFNVTTFDCKKKYEQKLLNSVYHCLNTHTHTRAQAEVR